MHPLPYAKDKNVGFLPSVIGVSFRYGHLPEENGMAQNERHSDFGSLSPIRYGSGCCCGLAPHFPFPEHPIRNARSHGEGISSRGELCSKPASNGAKK